MSRIEIDINQESLPACGEKALKDALISASRSLATLPSVDPRNIEVLENNMLSFSTNGSELPLSHYYSIIEHLVKSALRNSI